MFLNKPKLFIVIAADVYYMNFKYLRLKSGDFICMKNHQHRTLHSIHYHMIIMVIIITTPISYGEKQIVKRYKHAHN